VREGRSKKHWVRAHDKTTSLIIFSFWKDGRRRCIYAEGVTMSDEGLKKRRREKNREQRTEENRKSEKRTKKRRKKIWNRKGRKDQRSRRSKIKENQRISKKIKDEIWRRTRGEQCLLQGGSYEY